MPDSPERRFNDDEIAQIFARATEVQSAAPRQIPSPEGMSLVELQAIGREAGIAPELVAEAARSLDQISTPPVKKFLGMPVSVAHTVELGRKMSDAEWDRLVVQCRETFEARGKVLEQGAFRQWTNGNLQVLLEPSENGDRIRFRSVHANARFYLQIGLGLMAVGAVTVASAMLGGGLGLGAAFSDTGWLGLVGAVFFGVGVVRLPGWVRVRSEQMRRLGARLLGAGEG